MADSIGHHVERHGWDVQLLACDGDVNRAGRIRAADRQAHRCSFRAANRCRAVRLRHGRDILAVNRDDDVVRLHARRLRRAAGDRRAHAEVILRRVDIDADADELAVVRVLPILRGIRRQEDGIVVARRAEHPFECAIDEFLLVERAVIEALFEQVERLPELVELLAQLIRRRVLGGVEADRRVGRARRHGRHRCRDRARGRGRAARRGTVSVGTARIVGMLIAALAAWVGGVAAGANNARSATMPSANPLSTSTIPARKPTAPSRYGRATGCP